MSESGGQKPLQQKTGRKLKSLMSREKFKTDKIMKSNILHLIGFITIYIVLNGCGGGISTVHNEYLGEFPSLEKHYCNKIEEKDKAIKECSDVKKNFELLKELELLEEERNNKVDEYLKANPLDKPLPFEPMADMPYTVKEVTIKNAGAGGLNLNFTFKVNEDIKNEYGGVEQSLFIYFKAVDTQGKDIKGTTTVATNFNRKPLKAGVEHSVLGMWQSKATKNLEDFAKIVQITREEYKNR